MVDMTFCPFITWKLFAPFRALGFDFRPLAEHGPDMFGRSSFHDFSKDVGKSGSAFVGNRPVKLTCRLSVRFDESLRSH